MSRLSQTIKPGPVELYSNFKLLTHMSAPTLLHFAV